MDPLCMCSYMFSHYSVVIANPSSVSHFWLIALVFGSQLLNSNEYTSEITWRCGGVLVHSDSKGVRSLNHWDIGLALFRKCLIWRNLKNGM